MNRRNPALEHYGAPDLLSRITTALGRMGKTPETATQDDLAAIDEFHIRGPAATAELIEILSPDASMHVLDAGSGLGGPARRLATTKDCRVTGIDLTAEYCAAGNELNRWFGLDKQIELQQGDVTDLEGFDDASFDAAWTFHVGMNIADKTAFYGEVARVVKPGGRFLLYDVLDGGKGAVHYPQPWARKAEDSHLSTLVDLTAELTAAGFAVISTKDHSDGALVFFETALERAAQASEPPPLGLHILLGPVVKQMLLNARLNLVEERLKVASLLCQRSA